ncbi:DUF397 domain-containing protein [Nonomuraea wenchangensis]|uniref:DUF397 domain-containing protein n=1 Tax=Nonomuraea wenchangensis TaxID=568860 RepID=A0A1I0EF87_9ACTN|nr:DUF397 domain-containing protein [Nonomuraea wenchangensis]SET43925.1 protein of unknown function [Nonomuraea wenchangensis]
MNDELADELKTAAWRKATASGANGGDCIEVAPLSGDRVGIRDTESPEQAPYVVRGSVFRAWVDGAKKGEFDF